MMFNKQNVANALGILKWKRRVKSSSSLTETLLKDISSEVELSDYGRAPSSCSESPSGFLNGESLNAEPIPDLDLFFERLYNYYCEKGLWCIIIKWMVELLSLGFMICFSGFFLLFVDWKGLRNAKCGMDAVESGTKPCDLAKDALHHYPLTPFTASKATIVGYLGIFSMYWVFCFLRFFVQLKDILGIRRYYYNRLNVTDNEIQTIPWASIMEKVVQLQSSERLCVVKDLSELDVVMRLMRKENYLIGMLNKGVLSFPISQWIPGCGPTVKIASDGTQHRLILPKTLEWIINWCIFQSMFDRNFCVKRDFISSPETLKKRLMVAGLAMLLLSPFLIIFMLVYLFLRHAEQFYNHPSTASSRRWSNLSKWVIREFNEVDHMFKHRMNSSIVHASDYLKQFPSPIISMISKFISFVSGGFAAILIIIAFLEESLLEGHIFGRNLFWYGAVFGTITAISRATIGDGLLVLDPDGAISLVLQHTHYMPKRWRAKTNTAMVRIEFETLFQYTGMMLLEEMASIFLTPYLLLFVVPKRVEDILQFIEDFTVHVEGVGHVCSFSVFDFTNHGNTNYGSPHNAPRSQRSSQGKLEKSFLSFHTTYPSWEPNTAGKQFLQNLKTFMDKNSQMERIHNPCPPQPYDFHSCLPHLANQKTDSYILDRYYTSRPNITPPKNPPFEVRIWMPPAKAEFGGQDRIHLEASTSVTGGSILRHEGSMEQGGEMRISHWWDREGRNTEGSFLEPPDFKRPCFCYDKDNLSDRSGEELDLRDSGQRMFRTNFMEDFESGGEEVRPHFGDIYSQV